MEWTSLTWFWLSVLYVLPLKMISAVLGLWLVAWIGIVCRFPKVFGRFAAEVVTAYRSSIGS